MRRAFDVVGSQVMDVHSGENVGIVADLLFDREGRLQGLLLEKKHWFAPPPFFPLRHVYSIGEDMVMVHGDPQALPEELSGKWYSFVTGDQQMTGLPVVTSNGKQLGILEDVYFQEEMGNIIGYELSDGFFADLMEGRRMIQYPDKLLFGKDAFVIQQDVENSGNDFH